MSKVLRSVLLAVLLVPSTFQTSSAAGFLYRSAYKLGSTVGTAKATLRGMTRRFAGTGTMNPSRPQPENHGASTLKLVSKHPPSSIKLEPRIVDVERPSDPVLAVGHKTTLAALDAYVARTPEVSSRYPTRSGTEKYSIADLVERHGKFTYQGDGEFYGTATIELKRGALRLHVESGYDGAVATATLERRQADGSYRKIARMVPGSWGDKQGDTRPELAAKYVKDAALALRLPIKPATPHPGMEGPHLDLANTINNGLGKEQRSYEHGR